MIARYLSTSGQVADIVKGQLIGSFDLPIDAIVSDSREIETGNNLFVPLIGEKFNGHDYIPELIKSGKVTAVLSSQDFDDLSNAAIIKCEDPLKALAMLASNHRDSLNTKIIGVTGTNGKTTVKELLHSAISTKFLCHKNQKNYNNEIGVPFTLLGLDLAHEFAVVEMGMNHAGEIERLSKTVKPNISIITSIGEGHIEFLKSVRNIALAKSEIFMGMEKDSVAFVNADCPYFDLICEQANKCGVHVKSYGIADNAEYFPETYSITDNGIEVKMFNTTVNVPMYGIHNVYNIVAVISVCEFWGLGDISGGLANFENVSGRNEIIHKEYTIINDTYNSNPSSVKSALKSLKVIFAEKRKIAVLSDMLELGEHADSLHYETGCFVNECKIDLLFVLGDLSEQYAKGAINSGMNPDNVFIFKTNDELIKKLKIILTKNDAVLVKGSRSTKMEEVVKALL